ncbi:MAG: potassium channel family protein [Candidatus Micrarchaeia archaeon]|jgi:voltage-gated potassium channel
MGEIAQESGNVILSAAVISGLLILFSAVVLIFLTGKVYLNLYYILDTFFDLQNSVATWDLAELALASPFAKFAIILAIVVLDNVGKLLVVSFVIAAVIDIISYANLEKYISIVHAKKMKNHIIICGYNKLSERLIGKILEMKRKKPRIVVIEGNESSIVELHHRHIPAVEGNCLDRRSLKLASADKAKIIVFTVQGDAENLMGAVEAKKMNKNIKILARATKEEIMTKMYRAGVDMCVLPEYLTGISMAEFILKQLRVKK